MAAGNRWHFGAAAPEPGQVGLVDQNGPYTEYKLDEAYLRSCGELVGDLEVMSVKDFD